MVHDFDNLYKGNNNYCHILIVIEVRNDIINIMIFDRTLCALYNKHYRAFYWF